MRGLTCGVSVLFEAGDFALGSLGLGEGTGFDRLAQHFDCALPLALASEPDAAADSERERGR